MPHVVECLGGNSHEVAGPEEALIKMRELWMAEYGDGLTNGAPPVGYLLSYFCYADDDGECECEQMRKLELSLN